MRKKYLALILSLVMCSSVFFSGCGKTADEPVIEEVDDEDEDDDKDDKDDDDDEDEKPSAPVIVKVIDDDTVKSQIDIFLEGRDEWVIPNKDAVLYEGTTYSLTDLDYNGRTELIVSYWEGMATISTVCIYEINEAGDGYYLLDMEFTGIDSELKSVPDFGSFSVLNGYYDKDNGIFHYLIRDWYAYSFANGGCRYYDVSFADGKVIADCYAKSESKGSDYDSVDTFTGPNGEMSEDAFFTHTGMYPTKYETKEFWVGLFYGDSIYSQDENIVEYMTDPEIKDILIDSYHLYAGKITYGEFFDRHIAENDPAQTSEGLFKDMIGSWGVYMTDAEGYIEYYTPDSQYYMTLDVYSDRTMHLEEYLNTDYEYTIDGELLDKADGMLIVQYMPPASDGMAYDFMLLTFTGIDEEGHLVVMCDSWNGNEYFPGSTWYFQRVD